MRLSTTIREALALEVLRHRFTSEIEKHVASRATFATDVYEDIYRKADREKIASLPDGWLPTSAYISAQFGEMGSNYETVSFSGGVSGLLNKLRKPEAKNAERLSLRILNKHQHGCAKVYQNDHRLSNRHQTLREAGKELSTRIEAASKQIEAALNSATTIPALIKLWPEIEPFTMRFSVVSPQLPTLPVAKLNEIFKLPVKQAA